MKKNYILFIIIILLCTSIVIADNQETQKMGFFTGLADYLSGIFEPGNVKDITGNAIAENSYWTNWLNRDRPSGKGDYETLVDFDPSKICNGATPLDIKCVTSNGEIDYTQTGQNYVCNTHVGGYCINSKQRNKEYCLDYKIKLKCPGCSSDLLTCPDGSQVSRNINNNCEFNICPDPLEEKCIESNGNCCLGNSCTAIDDECQPGTRYKFLGCDSECAPEYSCEVTSECTDSDGGINYKKEGTCSESHNGEGDYCSYENRYGILHEAYCSDNGCMQEEHVCETGEICRLNRCISGNPEDPICMDTDEGKNQFEKGKTYSINHVSSEDSCYVSRNPNTTDGSMTNECNPKTVSEGHYCGVYENYCENDNYDSQTFIECEFGCEDGACVQNPINNTSVQNPDNGTSVQNPTNNTSVQNPDNGTSVQNPDLKILCDTGVKICPDGSSVSRNSNNNCEFDVCPPLLKPDASTTIYTMVSSGYEQSCAIRENDSKLVCWGGGLPAVTNKDKTYLSFDAGYQKSCGILKSNGHIKCWGFASNGQIGDNFSYSQISVGAESGCGIRDDGRVLCWGWGYGKALGVSHPPTQAITPILIEDTNTYSDIDVDGCLACGVIEDSGRVKCWGKLGCSSSAPIYSLTPKLIDNDSYIDIDSSETGVCGILKSNGRVKCWGVGIKMGNGNDDTRNNWILTPTLTSDTSAYSSISVGSSVTCGILKNNGRVKCWGAGSHYRMGDYSTNNNLVPGLTYDTSSYLSVSAGRDHVCGLREDKKVLCWGYGGAKYQGKNRLGDGVAMRDNPVPTLIKCEVGACEQNPVVPGNTPTTTTVQSTTTTTIIRRDSNPIPTTTSSTTTQKARQQPGHTNAEGGEVYKTPGLTSGENETKVITQNTNDRTLQQVVSWFVKIFS